MNTQEQSTLEEVRDALNRMRRRLKNLDEIIKFEMEKMRERQLVKRKEAAKLIDVHPRTIDRMVERGEIHKFNKDGTVKHTNIKTAVFYDKRELLEANGS